MRWGIRRTPEQLGHRKEVKERKIQEKKEKVLRSGSRAEIYRNRKLLSDAEIDQAMRRVNKLEQIMPGSTEVPRKEKISISERVRRNKRDKILAKGNIKDVIRNRKYFTNDELRSALDRYQALDNLRQQSAKTSSANKAFGNIKNASDKIGILINAYTSYTKGKEIVNSLVNKGNRDKVLATGNIKDVLDNRQYFNDDELKSALNSYKTVDELRKQSVKTTSTTDTSDSIKKLTDLSSGVDSKKISEALDKKISDSGSGTNKASEVLDKKLSDVATGLEGYTYDWLPYSTGKRSIFKNKNKIDLSKIELYDPWKYELP